MAQRTLSLSIHGVEFMPSFAGFPAKCPVAILRASGNPSGSPGVGQRLRAQTGSSNYLEVPKYKSTQKRAKGGISLMLGFLFSGRRRPLTFLSSYRVTPSGWQRVSREPVRSTGDFFAAHTRFIESRRVVAITRMSQVPWNFGGGPVSIRLRSPCHCARRVRQVRRSGARELCGASVGAGDRSHGGTACRPRPSRRHTSAAPSARPASV